MKIKYFSSNSAWSVNKFENTVNDFLARSDIKVLNFDWKVSAFGTVHVIITYEEKNKN